MKVGFNMPFQIKKEYENIYEWVSGGPGTCFYCKEDKPIEIKLIGDKGICNECVAAFKIGNIGADRHAIEHLSPDFKSHSQAKKWLEEHGAKLVFKYKSDGTYFYDCINDEKRYKAFQEKLKKDGFVPIGSKEDLFSSNSVEISEDGFIHIIY